MSFGVFCLVLHSHLPYYRKSGRWPFGEENLFEAIQGTYLPLLTVLDELSAEGLRPNATIGITPILAEQLADPYLQAGFLTYMADRRRLSVADLARFELAADAPFAELAKLAIAECDQIVAAFDQFGPNLLTSFRRLQDAGAIELITSAATHCFSPLVGDAAALAAQYTTGMRTHGRHFGRAAKGFWLPECAYAPGVEDAVEAAGIGFFFVEGTAIEGGKAAGPAIGPYEGLAAPAGWFPETGLTTMEAFQVAGSRVAVMGRHQRCSGQVWSATTGYPGDGVYREFHQKDSESGNRYWRLTGRKVELGFKEIYEPAIAKARVEAHADHFVGVIHEELAKHHAATGQTGVVMVPFDTELFGHWWFEGIDWLKAVWRRMAQAVTVRPMTVSQALLQLPPRRSIEMPKSSWGAGGTYWVWDNPDVAFMWPLIHEAEAEMVALAKRFDSVTGLQQRALAQAARELLLLESSDWPFLVTTGQAKTWALERFELHRTRFTTLASALRDGAVTEALVAEIEAEDICFQDVDTSLYARAVTDSVSR